MEGSSGSCSPYVVLFHTLEFLSAGRRSRADACRSGHAGNRGRFIPFVPQKTEVIPYSQSALGSVTGCGLARIEWRTCSTARMASSRFLSSHDFHAVGNPPCQADALRTAVCYTHATALHSKLVTSCRSLIHAGNIVYRNRATGTCTIHKDKGATRVYSSGQIASHVDQYSK